MSSSNKMIDCESIQRLLYQSYFNYELILYMQGITMLHYPPTKDFTSVWGRTIRGKFQVEDGGELQAVLRKFMLITIIKLLLVSRDLLHFTDSEEMNLMILGLSVTKPSRLIGLCMNTALNPTQRFVPSFLCTFFFNLV